MGVVYSGIELLNGAIPRDGAHIQAAEMVLERTPRLPAVSTVLTHGSVMDGLSNLRSDLDVVVVHECNDINEVPEVVDAVHAEFDQIGSETSVKIEANIWPANEPLRARKQRMYDILFCWHLREAFRDEAGLRGKADELTIEVADTLPAGDVESIRDVALNYAVYKQGGFTGAPRVYSDGDPRALTAMQRGLELPKAIGRKVAQLVAACEGREVAGNDFKFDLGLLDDTTRSALATLAKVNSDYTYYLEGLLGVTDPESVGEYVDWLKSAYSTVIANGTIATLGLTRFIHDFNG